MRQSRWLALFLATQFIPFAAWAQTRTGAPPANSNQDDEEEEEEEEEESSSSSSSSSASSASSSASSSSASSSSSSSDEPAETDEARRERILGRHSSLDGSIGLLHTTSAQTGAAGSFRFGVIGEYFGSSEFLRQLSFPGGSMDTAEDARHVGGTLTLSYSPWNFLEIFASVRAYANSNTRERPSLFQVLGDSIVGIKGSAHVTRGLYLGGDASVYLLNRSGDVGLLLDSTSFQLRFLSTLDLREFSRNVPLRVHFNARYYFDNSASIVADTEQRRREAQPGYDAAVCADPTRASTNPACFLEISRVERFALGINRLDQVGLHIGVDATLPYVSPFVEWSVGIPVNRQNYACFDSVTSGVRPGGARDDDSCFDTEGFSSTPSKLSIGARVLPPIRGLSALVAFDIGTTGTTTFVRDLAPTLPWQLYIGASFAYDNTLSGRPPAPVERVVTREVDRTPPGGRITGSVRDAETHSGVNHAIVTFTGHPDLHILASASDGSFRSGRLSPGEYRLHVEAEGYNAGDCTATINAPAAPAATPGAAGGSSAPATGTTGAGTTPAAPPAASVDADATVTCELRPQPRRGSIAGRVLSSQGGAGVAGATVVVTPAQGFRVPQGQTAPTERTAMTDGNGRFDLGDMLVGPYAVSVQASERHMAATPVNVNVEARMPANVDITVTRRPARPSVTLMGNVLLLARQVHFQVNSADILPDSNTLLEEIADVLHRNSSITAVEIQGHTDNSGQPDRNMTLSQQRAEAVRDRLVALGIRMDMLTARGFGQTRPIRPNLTAVGRAMNRRVEIHVSRGASTGATGGATGGAARPAAGGAARPAAGGAAGGAARPAAGGAAGGAPRP